MEYIILYYLVPLLISLIMEIIIGGHRNISALPFIPIVNILWIFGLLIIGSRSE